MIGPMNIWPWLRVLVICLLMTCLLPISSEALSLSEHHFQLLRILTGGDSDPDGVVEPPTTSDCGGSKCPQDGIIQHEKQSDAQDAQQTARSYLEKCGQSLGTLYLTYNTGSVHAALHLYFDTPQDCGGSKPNIKTKAIRMHQTAVGQNPGNSRFFRATRFHTFAPAKDGGPDGPKYKTDYIGKYTFQQVWDANTLRDGYKYNSFYNCAVAVANVLSNLSRMNARIATNLYCMMMTSSMMVHIDKDTLQAVLRSTVPETEQTTFDENVAKQPCPSRHDPSGFTLMEVTSSLTDSQSQSQSQSQLQYQWIVGKPAAGKAPVKSPSKKSGSSWWSNVCSKFTTSKFISSVKRIFPRSKISACTSSPTKPTNSKPPQSTKKLGADSKLPTKQSKPATKEQVKKKASAQPAMTPAKPKTTSKTQPAMTPPNPKTTAKQQSGKKKRFI